MKVERNFDFFMAGKSEGLTQAGMGRLNQSNEAFVYCILGAQVTIRSSILGSSGSATEVQHEFLILVEDPIRTPEISTSVQRFQLATDEAKVGLDLALSPSHLEIKLLEPDAKAKARSFSSPANSKPASIPLLDIVRSRSNAGKSQCQLDHNTRTLNPQEWPHLHVPFGLSRKKFKDLSTAEFIYGFLDVVKPKHRSIYDATSDVKYRWNAVLLFHATVLNRIEASLADWGANFSEIERFNIT